MARRNWKHKRYSIPRDFAEVTDAALLKACRSAKLPLVHRPGDDGERTWAPAWAAHAPPGTSAGMLRRAKRDPDMRAALVAAAALAGPQQPAGRTYDFRNAQVVVNGVDLGVGPDVTVHTVVKGRP